MQTIKKNVKPLGYYCEKAGILKNVGQQVCAIVAVALHIMNVISCISISIITRYIMPSYNE